MSPPFSEQGWQPVLLEDMASAIETAALATRGVDLFIGGLPPNPSSCCALIEYGGEPPLRTQNEGAAHSSAQGGERPRFQLVCRNPDYSTGRSLIQSMWSVLDAIVNETVGAAFYLKVGGLQTPFLLQRDENNRWIFAANFAATKSAG